VTARPRARFPRAGDTPERDNVVVADKVQSALKKLQAEARKKSGSDGLDFACRLYRAIPKVPFQGRPKETPHLPNVRTK